MRLLKEIELRVVPDQNIEEDNISVSLNVKTGVSVDLDCVSRFINVMSKDYCINRITHIYVYSLDFIQNSVEWYNRAEMITVGDIPVNATSLPMSVTSNGALWRGKGVRPKQMRITRNPRADFFPVASIALVGKSASRWCTTVTVGSVWCYRHMF